MKKLCLLGACLITLNLVPVAARATDPDVVVVQVADYGSATDVYISRGDNKTEMINIKHKIGANGMPSRGEGLRTVLLNLTREGYSLRTASNESSGYTTYVFVRQ